jgi:hypothetical protein
MVAFQGTSRVFPPAGASSLKPVPLREGVNGYLGQRSIFRWIPPTTGPYTERVTVSISFSRVIALS